MLSVYMIILFNSSNKYIWQLKSNCNNNIPFVKIRQKQLLKNQNQSVTFDFIKTNEGEGIVLWNRSTRVILIKTLQFYRCSRDQLTPSGIKKPATRPHDFQATEPIRLRRRGADSGQVTGNDDMKESRSISLTETDGRWGPRYGEGRDLSQRHKDTCQQNTAPGPWRPIPPFGSWGGGRKSWVLVYGVYK